MNLDVVLVDIISDVASKMRVSGISSPTESNIYYEPGRMLEILTQLVNADQSLTYKGFKYPLIGMVMPIAEGRGSGHYAKVRIDRIFIATLTTYTDSVRTKYAVDGTFKSVLYPCYYEFMKRLAQSPMTNVCDPDDIPHTKLDNPGQQPVSEGTNDFIDSIEILNLEIILTQLKTC